VSGMEEQAKERAYSSFKMGGGIESNGQGGRGQD